MLEKEKLFSKFNLNDYNQKIEEILEKKSFSEEAENLLLGMFYKIEACYKDYEMIKNECDSEKQFIERLLEIIENDCNEIIVLKPVIGKKVAKYKIYKAEKRIEVFPNEFNILYALLLIGGTTIKKDDDATFMSRCINQLLNYGEAMNKSEVIRDYTG